MPRNHARERESAEEIGTGVADIVGGQSSRGRFVDAETDLEAPGPQCGDPFLYPIPAPGGDPWEHMLKPLLKKDKEQCDAWRDEVQNLLIFVSAFIAQNSERR